MDALKIGVAGLAANSQALSATSSNIANVNTVGYKEATASFSTFLNATGGVGDNASAGVAVKIGQDVTTQGLPTIDLVAHRPVDLGQRLLRGRDQCRRHRRRSEYTRAGSFTPDANGNLVNAAGLYLLGYKLDSAGNVPTNSSDLSLINISSLSGTAQAHRRPDACRPICSPARPWMPSYTAGDMTSGTVTPDFTAHHQCL